MNTYEQFLASPHKTAWMQKDDFHAIQADTLEWAQNQVLESTTQAGAQIKIGEKIKSLAAMPNVPN